MFCPVVFGGGLLLSEPRGSDIWGLYAIGSGVNRNNDTLYWEVDVVILRIGNVNWIENYMETVPWINIVAGNKPEKESQY